MNEVGMKNWGTNQWELWTWTYIFWFLKRHFYFQYVLPFDITQFIAYLKSSISNLSSTTQTISMFSVMNCNNFVVFSPIFSNVWSIVYFSSCITCCVSCVSFPLPADFHWLKVLLKSSEHHSSGLRNEWKNINLFQHNTLKAPFWSNRTNNGDQLKQ